LTETSSAVPTGGSTSWIITTRSRSGCRTT
jgi:hypothetical protein